MDNGLALAPLDWVERRDGVIEGRGGSDVRVKMPVPHPVGNLRQLARNGLDDEVDREAAAGPRRARRLGLECPLSSSTGQTG